MDAAVFITCQLKKIKNQIQNRVRLLEDLFFVLRRIPLCTLTSLDLPSIFQCLNQVYGDDENQDQLVEDRIQRIVALILRRRFRVDDNKFKNVNGAFLQSGILEKMKNTFITTDDVEKKKILAILISEWYGIKRGNDTTFLPVLNQLLNIVKNEKQREKQNQQANSCKRDFYVSSFDKSYNSMDLEQQRKLIDDNYDSDEPDDEDYYSPMESVIRSLYCLSTSEFGIKYILHSRNVGQLTFNFFQHPSPVILNAVMGIMGSLCDVDHVDHTFVHQLTDGDENEDVYEDKESI
ncbi:MAG: hypothetical protein EZS28_025819 [Streblomastix strix]|uniref:Uncharacterized protein n=1 Tax=Streblomastix strix TaxID=222440 RepID=A0A5J4V7Y6_9EUKA|nr:MAG: hypothetical protein EZS28_025819 [Streblomastix strix]